MLLDYDGSSHDGWPFFAFHYRVSLRRFFVLGRVQQEAGNEFRPSAPYPNCCDARHYVPQCCAQPRYAIPRHITLQRCRRGNAAGCLLAAWWRRELSRLQQWMDHRSIFGSWGSQSRRNGDPFVLARSADPAKTPYLFLTCGEQEGLLSANRNFATLLERRHFRYEFHVVPGAHDWNQWDKRLPGVFQGLREHMGSN
jgi:hypothetical protein